MKIYRAVLSFIFFSVLLAVPPLLLNYTGNTDLLTPHFWLLFFYISGLTLLVIIAVLLSQRGNSEAYAQVFLAATTFKILACLIFMVVFLRKNHVDKLIFVADFFYIYFLNTAFEVYGLLRNLRNQNLR
jgi:hypothetical protein